MCSTWPRLVLARTAMGVALFDAPGSWGQVTEHPVLLALSKTDHAFSIVDPVTLKVIAKMPVGPDPHEVIASADGTRAWVSNMLNTRVRPAALLHPTRNGNSSPIRPGGHHCVKTAL